MKDKSCTEELPRQRLPVPVMLGMPRALGEVPILTERVAAIGEGTCVSDEAAHILSVGRYYFRDQSLRDRDHQHADRKCDQH